MTKILVIDDEEDLRLGIGAILADLEGYEVVLAENGRNHRHSPVNPLIFWRISHLIRII